MVTTEEEIEKKYQTGGEKVKQSSGLNKNRTLIARILP
jgi:hypothetical protein